MGIDRQKTIRTLRLSLTCILLFFVTWYYQVPESVWSLITVFTVMYEYSTVGGVLTKGILRLTGTFLSAVYGLTIVYFCANNPIINMMALIPGLFLYAYYFMSGDRTYISIIGAITLVIVLFNYNDIDTAVLRVFNVMIGIASSLFMIRFFYPQYARNKVLDIQLMLIEQLASLITDYLNSSNTLSAVKLKYPDYEQNILNAFSLYNRYIGEAKIETYKTPEFIVHSEGAMLQYKQLFRLISVLLCYLANDAIREDPWVFHEVEKLLWNLESLQQKLRRQVVIKKDAELMPDEIDEDNAIDTLNLEHKIATEAILNSVQDVIGRLDAEIEKLTSIYDVYNIELEPVKA
tara:strand:- start:3794 stop:4837 length:1044 start_codon:yes stop_codon:yes gene_type:complete